MSGVSTNQARLDRNKPKHTAVKGNDLHKVSAAVFVDTLQPVMDGHISCVIVKYGNVTKTKL